MCPLLHFSGPLVCCLFARLSRLLAGSLIQWLDGITAKTSVPLVKPEGSGSCARHCKLLPLLLAVHRPLVRRYFHYQERHFDEQWSESLTVEKSSCLVMESEARAGGCCRCCVYRSQVGVGYTPLASYVTQAAVHTLNRTKKETKKTKKEEQERETSERLSRTIDYLASRSRAPFVAGTLLLAPSATRRAIHSQFARRSLSPNR